MHHDPAPSICEIGSYLASAAKRKASLQAALNTGEWSAIESLSPDPAAQILKLANEAEIAATAADTATKPDQKAALQKELSLFDERERLAREIAVVSAEVDRLALRKRLLDCVSDTDTAAITRKSTELTKAAVSDALCQRFEDELKALGLKHLSVVLDPTGGEKGTLYHKVEIRRADGTNISGVSRVLSEGEQRCIALAAFLAELTTQASVSTIILDDPVSSLDHERRETIAKRLIAESQHRPVVVFTHDLVFLLSLDRLAKKSASAFAGRHLRRTSKSVGTVIGDLPWYGLPVSRRIGVLKERHQRLATLFKEGEHDQYRDGVWLLYGLLRETWERAVEEVLFNLAIERYGREVQTKRLEKVVDVTAADYSTLEAGMDRCSTFNAGHDSAPEVNLVPPEPDEVLADIVSAEAWVASIRKRRK